MFPFLALFLPQNSPSCANFIQWFEMGGYSWERNGFSLLSSLTPTREKRRA